MRNRLLPALIACATLFASCSKSDDNNPTPNNNVSYELYGLDQSGVTASTSIIQANFTFAFLVKLISGQKESVTLSTYDVPKGVTISFLSLSANSITSAQIGDTIVCNLDMDSTIKVGNYYPKIKSVSTSGITVVDSFLIEVKP